MQLDNNKAMSINFVKKHQDKITTQNSRYRPTNQHLHHYKQSKNKEKQQMQQVNMPKHSPY
jgi:hypothetical protein